MPQSQSKATEVLCHQDYIQNVLLSIKIINKTSTSYNSGKFSLLIINKILIAPKLVQLKNLLHR